MHGRESHRFLPRYFFYDMNNLQPDITTSTDQRQWYAIRVTYNRELKVKADLDERGIENFLPMHYVYKTVDDKRVRRLVPAIHNLIFMLADQATMAQYKSTTALPIRYIMNRETQRPMVVPRRQMDNFIAVAGTNNEQLIYLDEAPMDFKKGDKVKILGGIFEGAEGTFMRIKGDRRVVVSIPGIIAVATMNIHPSLLQRITNQ